MILLQLRGADIDGSNVFCTGAQVASVLDKLAIAPELARCIWYAGRIDASGAMSQSHRERALSRVVDLAGLIASLRSATQLRDGVFVAIEDSMPPILLAEIVTADGPIGRLVADAVVEVHVFDTSSIDIYSTHQSVLDWVRFGSTLRDDRGVISDRPLARPK